MSILNLWLDLDGDWFSLQANSRSSNDPFEIAHSLTGVFWGGAGRDLAALAVDSQENNFNKERVLLEPIASSPSSLAYPHLASLSLKDAQGLEKLEALSVRSPLLGL